MIGKVFLKQWEWVVTLVIGLIGILLASLPVPAQELVWEQTNGPYGGIIKTLLATPDGMLYAGTYNGGIFRSEDRGNSWTAVNKGLRKNFFWGYEDVSSLAIIGTTLFAGSTWGVYYSEDRGNTWLPTGLTRLSGNAILVRSLAVIGNTLFAGTGEGLYRSEDLGNSWTEVGAESFRRPEAMYAVHSLTIMDQTLYAGTWGGGIFRSEDRGNTWTEVNAGLPKGFYGNYKFVMSLAVMGTTLFASIDEAGVYRSEDKGNTWLQVNTGLTNFRLGLLAVKDTMLFVRTWEGLFRSEDRGGSWLKADLPTSSVWSFAVMDATLFVGTSGGVFRSEDNGKTWTLTSTGLLNTLVSSLAVMGTTLFAAIEGGGIFRSDDKGSRWTEVNNGLPNKEINSLAVMDATLFAGAWRRPSRDIPIGIFRSEDMGNSWTTAHTGYEVMSLAVLGKTLFMLVNGGVILRSEDKGDSWTEVVAPRAGSKPHALSVSGTSLYVSFIAGWAFRSEDGGNSWNVIKNRRDKNGEPTPEVNALAAIGTTLFAGTSGGGVLRASLADETVVAVDEKGKMLTSWGKVKTTLLQNYPNPFNPETWIPFSLAGASEVTIRIYGIQGNLIRTLNLRHKEKGFYLSKDKAAYWDGKNELGEVVSNGLYFYRLDAGAFTAVQRMVLVK